MDSLVTLAVLVALTMPLLLIVFMVWVVQLSRRLRGLEAEVAALRVAPAPAPCAEAPAEAPPPATEPAPPVEITRRAAAGRAPSAESGPWVGAPPEAPTRPAAPPGPPKAVVLRAETAAALGAWLKANWIYAVSAVSLAAAGIFFVQYGIEAGLLPPTARVVAALLFGLALVGAGEVVRRRWGDREEATTAFIPSVFSGAGIVTLFGAVLAALHLYGLISPGLAFAGLVAVAALAVGLGWYTGPLLAAIGVAGAMAAPFVVGGESESPELFYLYFGVVALVGLAIDAGRRWAWVSVLTLALAYPAVTMLHLSIGAPTEFAAVLVALMLATMAIPTLTLSPAHGGAALIERFGRGRPRGWPIFPTRLVAAASLATAAGLVLASLHDLDGFVAACVGFAVSFAALALWARRAEALEDLALLPGAGLIVATALQALADGSVYRPFVQVLEMEEGTPIRHDPYWLTALALGFSLTAAWRSRVGARWPVAWAAGAALMAPLMLVTLEVTWAPARVLGAYPWALTALAVGAAMTVLALIFARLDGTGKARVAGFVLAALAMITLALTLLLTETALTLALAVVTLAAALIDRRFDLRPLSVAVQVGAIALGWRLILDPGLDWAQGAPYWELIVGYGGAVAALGASLRALRPRPRPAARAVAESAAVTLGATFASVLTMRLIEDIAPAVGPETHWAMGLLATVWLAAAAGQLWRTRVGGRIRRLRFVLAGVYGALGVLFVLLAAWPMNPLLSADPEASVLGPVLINTLAPAYLLPAAVLGFTAWRFGFLPRWLRLVLAAAGAALGLLWAGLVIRHVWQGPDLSRPGVTEPELYAYTIALLVLGGGLLWRAIAGGSGLLRKLAMAVIALTVAKVFLVDASGLVGLLRVFSFLALGLSLAGLAVLNRWAAARMADGQ